MNKTKKKKVMRRRRQMRVGRKLSGTPQRPRLAVFRSNRHIYCQVIDDENARTLASASTMEMELKSKAPWGGNRDAAGLVGALIAERAKKAGVDKVVFDRRAYRYHGRVRALAEAAREGGLVF